MISLKALTFLKLIQFYSETNVRLTGHNSTFAGRVEVFSHGVWGRVINYPYYWRKKEADIVCRQLGFPEAITAVGYSAFGEGSGPVLMSRVRCLGTEKTLQRCSYQDWVDSDLSPGYEVGVICKTFNLQPDNNDNLIRLQGSTLPYAGRVEVFYTGVWGAISSSNWDINDATVVCRQLGYLAGAEVTLKNGVYGPVSGPVWITNLQCTGSESNVMECVHDGLGNKTELQHRAVTASVICKDSSFNNVMRIRLRGSHSSNMGRIEVHYAGTWGSVYASGWDIKDATVACRQLGYHSASVSGSGIFCSSDISVWFAYFKCFGDETSLEQCSRDFYQYSTTTYCANAVCTDKKTEEAPGLRLSGSPVRYAGRVEVRIKGVWGTIFQNGWYYRTLGPEVTRVICRQLGFSDAVISVGHSVYGPGVDPLWLDSSRLHGCLGHEKNILNCSNSSPSFTLTYGHDSDASVVCKPKTSYTSDFQVRLNGSSLSSAGTINVLYYGIWGGILSHNVDIRVGHVVCRQLGYSKAERIFRYPSFGRVIGPLWIWSIQCNGNEAEISQCKVETWDKIWKTSWYNWRYRDRYYQQHPRNAASLLCSKENSNLSKVLNLRLVGAPISNAGRVEVLYVGVWGTIRGGNWDINGAHVVCRQLGYPGAVLFGSSKQFGIGNGPSWFQNVRCLGNESSFEECSKDILGYPNGGYWSVATVLCESKPQLGSSENCSTTKCSSNGTCINTSFGPICNCSEGFTGPSCEIRTLSQCKSSPCQNGGRCFSDGFSYLCTCPKGLTGQHCKKRLVVASNPCQSYRCPEDSACYHNDTHFTCVSHHRKNAQSTSSSIAGLSVAVVLVFVFAAATGCLVFKIRRLTNNQSNHSRAVFSNRAYRADSERKPDDEASINEVDLGVGPSPGGPDPKPPIYDNPSRPLPPVPQTSNTNAGPPCSSARQTTESHYDNGTKPGQAARHYMGLTTKYENITRPFSPEPSSYMSLSPERPEAGSYEALATARPQTPRPVKPRQGTHSETATGNPEKKGRDSDTSVTNTQG